MSTALPAAAAAVEYPESDGEPMADNTKQFRWIVTFQGNLERLCVGDRAAFVAGDNLIYPVEGNNLIRQAPDVYVAFGRPPGDRGSYRVWDEGGVFPQVVIEVLSPSNRAGEMNRKRQFYQRYGAEEYYVYDPDDNWLAVWVRQGDRLAEVPDPNGWTSPRLGIRFDTTGPELVVHRPDGSRFLTFAELDELAAAERRRAEQERRRAEQERRRAEQAEHERQQAEADNARLRGLLRKAGIDPDAAR